MTQHDLFAPLSASVATNDTSTPTHSLAATNGFLCSYLADPVCKPLSHITDADPVLGSPPIVASIRSALLHVPMITGDMRNVAQANGA